MPLLRCECFGHASSISYVEGNSTHPGHCVCDCHSSTNTEGETVSVFSLCLNNYEFNISFYCLVSGNIQAQAKEGYQKFQGGGGSQNSTWSGALGGTNKKGHENGMDIF